LHVPNGYWIAHLKSMRHRHFWIHKRVSMRYCRPMSSKDVGLRIRVEKELREAFQGACMAEKKGASEVLREFMQAYAERHQGGLQADMFTEGATRKARQPAKRKAL